MWEIQDLLAISDKMDANQKRDLLRIEQEKERKRKMSAPYGSTFDMTDEQWAERSRRLSSVHEDLLRVFSVQSVSSIHKCCKKLYTHISLFQNRTFVEGIH